MLLSQQGCTWAKNTNIDSITTLYDLDDNVNGYIYDLKTGGKATGYIQVDCSLGDPYISSFSFDGQSNLNAMPKADKLAKETTANSKIYYLDGFEYGRKVKQGNGDAYFSLTNDSVAADSIAAIDNQYKKSQEQKKADKAAEKAAKDAAKASTPTATNMSLRIPSVHLGAAPLQNASGTVTVTPMASAPPSGGTGYGTSTYVTGATTAKLTSYNASTADYISVSAPVACVNIMKYWSLVRGYSKLYCTSDAWMYNWFSQTLYPSSGLIDFAGGSFVLPASSYYDEATLYYGQSFFAKYRGQAYNASMPGPQYISSSATGYSSAKTYVNANRPFVIFINTNIYGPSVIASAAGSTTISGQPGTRAITCFGYIDYYTSSKVTSSYYIINNSWDLCFRYENIANLHGPAFAYFSV